MGSECVTVAAVADAGPLIHLAEIDSLELLSSLDTLYVPEEVYEELDTGGVPSGLEFISYELVGAESSPFEESDLDRGETAALAVAVERNLILLTDDLAARETAEKADVQARGSLGVIALAYGRDRLEKDEAADRMRALQRETSLFVTDAVVERGIQLLETDE